jgi:hypothetical protein
VAVADTNDMLNGRSPGELIAEQIEGRTVSSGGTRDDHGGWVSASTLRRMMGSPAESCLNYGTSFPHSMVMNMDLS